jgi:hypothetical protein
VSRLEEIINVVKSQNKSVRKLSHNDLNWLIQQTETLHKIADSWVDVECHGTEVDANVFYTVVQNILADNEQSKYPLKPTKGCQISS